MVVEGVREAAVVVIFVLLSVSTPPLQLGSMCAPTTITFPLFLILLAL